MAVIAVKVPNMGESITEGILSNWRKNDGEAVKRGDILFEIDTDKATKEIYAEADGVLKVISPVGSTVAVGADVGSIDTLGTATATAAAAPAVAAPAAVAVAAPVVVATEPVGKSPVSPAALRLATESHVPLEGITGSGRGNLIIKEDVQKAIPLPTPVETPAPVAPAPAVAVANVGPTFVPVTPPPSASNAAAAAAKAAAVASTSTSANASAGPRETRIRMTTLRQRIASRLLEAQQNAAILTTFNEADMSRVMEMRAQYKDPFKTKHAVNLGFMSFFLKASVEALKKFPNVNARIDGNDVVQCHYYDVGVAVSTERGLMVPVIRDVDQKNFAQLEQEIVRYANKARDGKIEVSDLMGGTFTITNGGVFGSLLSTPILNPPQSAILGMHTIQKRPVAVNDQVVIRPMMYLALSYDHRIIDGKEAVSFLVRIKECLENPERLLLDI